MSIKEGWLIIWPQRRVVDEEQIRTWYEDAVANGDAEETNLTDPYDMAKELENIGIITLGDPK